VSARTRAVLALLWTSLSAVPALAADPTQNSQATTIYERALELQQRGNDGAALALLWDAAALAPGDADIQNALGEALERIGALDAAVTTFRAALAARPGFPKASNNLILSLAKSGRGAEAVERARVLVAAAPTDPERHLTLALAQSEQDVSGAVESFHRALALDPRHVLARYNLALTLSRIDRADQAIEELHRAIEIEARPQLYYALGVIYWHQGDLDRAAGALREAASRNDRYAEAYSTLGAVLQGKRDWKGASAALGRAIAIRPDFREAHDTLAQVLQRAGDDAHAREEFDRAATLRERAAREQEASVLTAAGAQQVERGELRAAVETFRRATAVLNTYAPAYYQMGRALDTLGEHGAAHEAFARAQRLNPSLLPPQNHR
jgi:tetratricopeptide (TPR) repeat protein